MKSSQKRKHKCSKDVKIHLRSLIIRKMQIKITMTAFFSHSLATLKDFRNYTDKDVWKQAFPQISLGGNWTISVKLKMDIPFDF